jgi:uncharacterized protein (UPF0332 family)
MVSEVNLYFIRAEDEFLLSKKDMQLSTDLNAKEFFGIPKDKTFFYSVISHAYYSIFYSAKAYLFSKGIKIFVPNEHKKVYTELLKLTKEKILDKDLFDIYEFEIIKADSLLQIFRSEKKKRGKFTYQIKSEANIPFAQESIRNAENLFQV